MKAPEPKTMHEAHKEREVRDVSRGSANGRVEGETCEPIGQSAAEPGRRLSERCDNCDSRDLADPPAEQADGADARASTQASTDMT